MIQVEGAEGDDVIAVITRSISPAMNFRRDVIYSTDRDLAQLVGVGVDWWNWRKNELVTHEDFDADTFLREKIIRGDIGDGIPNVLSEIDVLVTEGKRQNAMSSGRYTELMGGCYEPDSFIGQRVEQNRVLMDLRRNPLKEIHDNVCDVFLSQMGTDKSSKRRNLLNYFIKYRLPKLREDLTDF